MKILNSLWTYLSKLGPALVLATVVIGPGSLTLNTLAGNNYGYRLLWVPIVATVFMIAFVWMSARIGLVTGKTLFQVTREKYGSLPALVGGMTGFLAILAFQAGNNAAVGLAADELFGFGVRFWAFLLYVPALLLLFLPDLYNKLEFLVKVIVGLLILSFVGTLLLVGVDLRRSVTGLVPGFPNTESVYLTLGIASTTFSIAAAVYQGYLMKEKDWGAEDLTSEGVDSLLGIGILGLISTVVLLTSAGALHQSGREVQSAADMAAQLEPLVGPMAFYLFTTGFLFASLSSLIVNPLIGATLLVDGYGGQTSMDGRPVKIWTAATMTVGLGIVLYFRNPPVELIRTAQGLAVVAFPVLGYLVLDFARDRDIMGRYAVNRGVLGIGVLGFLTVLAIVLNYLRILSRGLF